MTPAVLVIGGAGYIGSHTCKALRSQGLLPVTFDNLSLGHESFVKWGPFVRASLADAGALRGAIATYDPVAVIHFAAFAYVGESMSNPGKYYTNNVVGTLALLDAMTEAGVDKIVFSSSCSVYGEPERHAITESTPTLPINPYGRSKLMCEGMISDYGSAYGVQSVVLRYFNASGADPGGEVGELRDPETHLIPRAMMALQGHIDDFQVFGNDFPTPDGTAIRDYVHVADLAQAHVLAVKRMIDGQPGGTFNLGGGQGHSVGEVLRVIRAVSGRDLASSASRRRPGDPARLVADASLARDVLGFQPVNSDLHTIVDTAWRWHLKAHPARETVDH